MFYPHSVRRARCFGGRPLLAGLALAVALVSTASGEAQRTGNIYSWRNPDGVERLTAWVPDTATAVRGFFFLGSHGGCPGADNRTWARVSVVDSSRPK